MFLQFSSQSTVSPLRSYSSSIPCLLQSNFAQAHITLLWLIHRDQNQLVTKNAKDIMIEQGRDKILNTCRRIYNVLCSNSGSSDHNAKSKTHAWYTRPSNNLITPSSPALSSSPTIKIQALPCLPLILIITRSSTQSTLPTAPPYPASPSANRLQPPSTPL